MKICFFGAASPHLDKKYLDEAYVLGEKLAKRGHSLVYGCGSSGLMGAISMGVRNAGGKIHGIIPFFFEEMGYEAIYYGADEMTYTETMAERKTLMEENADAFIIGPGGMGTMEEFFEVLTLKQLNRHGKAIAIFNIDGFYDGLNNLLDSMIKNKSMNEDCKKMYGFFDDVDKMLDYLENYKVEETDWRLLKK